RALLARRSCPLARQGGIRARPRDRARARRGARRAHLGREPPGRGCSDLVHDSVRGLSRVQREFTQPRSSRQTSAVRSRHTSKGGPMKNVLVLLAAVASALTAAGVVAAGERSGGARADAMAPTLMVRTTRYGRILFDGRGQVLYAFTHDRRSAP